MAPNMLKKRKAGCAMKKLFAVILSALLVISVAGCSGTEKDTSQVESQTSSSVDSESDAPSLNDLSYPEYPEYKALDYVTLGEYKGKTLQVTQISEEPTEEQLQAKINENIGTQEVEDKNATVQEGDSVSIDFSGTANGKEIANGEAKDYRVTIGSGALVDGFEDALVGMKKGERKEISVAFPDDFKDESLRGQTGKFEVELNAIYRIPELTDELASELTDGECTTVDAYKEKVRNDYIEEIKSQNETLARNSVMTAVGDMGAVNEIPQDLIDWYVDSMLVTYQFGADGHGMTLEDYLEAMNMQDGDGNANEKELVAYLKSSSENVLKNELILRAIAEQEGITVTDEEYQEGLVEYQQDYGFDTPEDFEKSYGKTSIESQILLNKVIDWLRSNNSVIGIGTAEAAG